MQYPFLSTRKAPGFSILIAANDPLGSVPDLQPIIRDPEHNRSGYQRPRPKKRPVLPTPQPVEQKNPDMPPHVDDYA